MVQVSLHLSNQAEDAPDEVHCFLSEAPSPALFGTDLREVERGNVWYQIRLRCTAARGYMQMNVADMSQASRIEANHARKPMLFTALFIDKPG
jgi:hypothetical protein